jgi:hypothetical protein
MTQTQVATDAKLRWLETQVRGLIRDVQQMRTEVTLLNRALVTLASADVPVAALQHAAARVGPVADALDRLADELDG